MEVSMVDPAHGHGELVADLACHCWPFGKFQVMRVRWCSSADETRLSRDKPQVIAVSLAHRLVDGDHKSSAGLPALTSIAARLLASELNLRPITQPVQPP